ncbi:3-hydroxyacyl-CoA dehydrogenase family protein [Paenibacillus sp. HW567]|uniref:3-hydroxyacyl-CoA dehydrogenase family protein n=1 Tax=Paenibacillus sp. HW567 TaxID=1034769 RepID=UPI0003683EDA|nr:3-hydroxyacyl-CoA dehydrogenase NAD-binding domain-containing protein [Paenibacillus sp. HW567]
MNTFETIGIIGAGVMGSDLALDLASQGYRVILKDIHEEALDTAKAKIREDFKLVKLMKKELRVKEVEQVLTNIRFTTTYQDFHAVPFVIENITENWEAKQQVYLELQEHCQEDTIYGVNTSCISITKVGAVLPKPENAIGMHFMNPVPLKQMVEIIKGYYTSQDTIQKIKDFLKAIDKKPVLVNDSPGFVTNRVLMPMINECIWAVHDGVATPQDVDKIFRLGFSHKMGPLATADLIGLDTILNSILVLYESYNDSKYRPCPLLVKMVDAGLLGKKSGKGFFDYTSVLAHSRA